MSFGKHILMWCIVVCVLLVWVAVSSQPVSHCWSKRFGDIDEEYAQSVAVDLWGNIVVAGYFAGSIDFGGGLLTSAGGNDIFLAKFDPSGVHLWSKHFGDTGFQYCQDVTIDAAGNIYITGYYSGSVDFGGGSLGSAGGNDIFIAKFDASGTHVWSQRFGDGDSQSGQGLATDAVGNVIAAGYFRSSVDFGGGTLASAGNNDIYIVKFDSTGTHLWSDRYGDAAEQYIYNIAVDGFGNIIATGLFDGAVDFGGGVLTSAGSFDIFLAKYNVSGAHQWSQRFGDSGDQRAQGIEVDSSGNITICGYYGGSVDFGGGALTSAGSWDIFLAQFNTAGAHRWSRRFGSSSGQICYDVAVDGAGNVCISGSIQGSADFGGGTLASQGSYDAFIAKFDAAGTHVWSQHYGDEGDQRSQDVAMDGSGGIIITGFYQGSIDFGGGTLMCAGGWDSYVAKIWQVHPVIRSVRDVPGDQGGWINLSWQASGMDTPEQQMITNYTVWRAIDPSMASSMISEGALLTASTEDWLTRESGEPAVRIQRIGAETYYWYLISSHDAYFLPAYSAPVPTLFDSTAVSTEYHYFQVIAHTSNPAVFYASDPDSGYSVDNLAPAAPQGFSALQSVLPAGLELTWYRNTESDLAHYTLYRGETLDFVPGIGNLVASPTDTACFDDEWTWDSGYFYKLTARDIHGNESVYTLLSPDDVTGGGAALFRSTYLAQNYPNPFNPSTQIAFGLAGEGAVSLKIYDASGRLIRVLVNGWREARRYVELWDGSDDAGRPVASGVYFYRLRSGERVLNRKMVLLK